MEEPPSDEFPRLGKIVFAWAVFLGCAILLAVALIPDRGSGEWRETGSPLAVGGNAPVVPEPPPGVLEEKFQMPPLRLLFWNIRGYAVKTGEGSEMLDGEKDGAKRKEKPEQDRERAAQVIASVEADVVALAEIMGEPALNDLRERLRKRGREYRYAETLFREGAGPGLALLSRFPLEASLSNSRTPLPSGGRMMRGILDVRLAAGAGRKARVVVVHLKSSFGDREKSSLLRREEAASLRNHLDELLRREPGTPVILCGDFNDGPSSPVLKAVAGKRGEPGYMRRLNPTDSRGERWTHRFRPEDSYSRLDYVFVRGGGAGQTSRPVFRASLGERDEVLEASDHRPVILDVTYE